MKEWHRAMRVVVLNYVFDPELAAAEALLARYEALTGWAEGLAAAGAQVTVLQRFGADRRIERGGITYELRRDRLAPRLHGWQVPWALHWRARGGAPDIVHVNGLLFPLQVRALRAMLPARSTIVAQHHAERPWEGRRAPLQRWGLGAIDGCIFAAHELGQRCAESRAIAPQVPIYQIMEGS